MNILITGGAGYIGSHTIVELLNSGYGVIAVDNLVNSSKESIRRVEKITGKSIKFYEIDVCDKKSLTKVFEENKIDAIIHFAGLKAVGESVAQPTKYYRNNIDSTLTLLEAMDSFGVRRLVFSSSATVYGDPKHLPIIETDNKSCSNPYGWTKLMIEQILQDVVTTKAGWCITSLRYFNPIGAHPSGLIGEDPNGIPNNLLPYISQVAIGKRDKLNIFGGDYKTPDGTGVRDYIHVVDLAIAHLSALEHIDHSDVYKAYNIGTGRGASVLEIVHAFEKASGRKISYEIVARRPGDIASCYADSSLANRELGWRAQYDIEKMCKDTWNWQSKNPNGYNN